MLEIGNGFQFELAETIRVNQLVRDKIDLAGFTAWYEQLSVPEQRALIIALIFFAEQAGGLSDDVWFETLALTNLESTNPLFENQAAFLRKLITEIDDFDEWLAKLSNADKFAVFTFIVHLFGVAEGKIYRKEQKDWCNHWWHRDLLDERVVQDILNDPKYYMTSMKDDDRIKNKTR